MISGSTRMLAHRMFARCLLTHYKQHAVYLHDAAGDWPATSASFRLKTKTKTDCRSSGILYHCTGSQNYFSPPIFKHKVTFCSLSAKLHKELRICTIISLKPFRPQYCCSFKWHSTGIPRPQLTWYFSSSVIIVL